MPETQHAHTSAPPAALAIVTPVFNDWAPFVRLLRELDALAASLDAAVHVFAVDDGSTEAPGTAEAELGDFRPARLAGVEVLRLRTNLGHQRAIGLGVAEAVRRGEFGRIAVMDSDGEDAPAELAKLLAASDAQPGRVVVARRAQRSEGVVFRAAYRGYQLAFRLLTGRQIDFGNFCVLPLAAARRLVFTPETWNHLAAALLKSRLPLERVATVRAARYAGRSTMSLVSLVVHGLSAISVFVETVITRMLVVFGATSLFAVATSITAVALRFGTNLAIPGWATNVFGLSLLLLLQSVTVLALLLFSVLNARSAVPFVVGAQAGTFLERTDVWFRRG